jgi:hypothetical protein
MGGSFFTTSFGSIKRSGDLVPPSPPAEKAPACQDQAGKTSTGDGTGNRGGGYREIIVGFKTAMVSLSGGWFVSIIWVINSPEPAVMLRNPFVKDGRREVMENWANVCAPFNTVTVFGSSAVPTKKPT